MARAAAKRKAGRPPKFKKRDVPRMVEAVGGSLGNISEISRRLGCDRDTAQAAIKKFPEVKAAYEGEVERTGDAVENVILNAIFVDGDVGTAKWWASKKLKGRGYGDDAADSRTYSVELVADVVKGELKARLEARRAAAQEGCAGEFAQYAEGSEEL